MSQFLNSFFRDPAHVFYTLAIFVQIVVFARWLLRSYANNQIQRKFVNDMATNHLPHIYHALKTIAEQNGVQLNEPPLVQWVKINGDSGKAGH